MSITDELREYADRLSDEAARKSEHGFSPVAMKLEGIADRIDAEHERAEQDLIDANNQMEQLCECSIGLPVDADGVPIHVGDTVYLDDGRKAEVRRIQLSERENSICFDVCGDFFSLWPEHLTHTAPDSFERIADELDAWCDRVDVDGDACDVPRDLAERIRKLAKEDEHV